MYKRLSTKHREKLIQKSQSSYVGKQTQVRAHLNEMEMIKKRFIRVFVRILAGPKWFLLRLDGGTASAGPCHSMLLGLSLLSNAEQVGLHSPELGEVEGSDLLGLLDLLLVRLDLALQLVNQGLHPLVVLPVLVLLVGQLLDVPLRLAQVLKSMNIEHESYDGTGECLLIDLPFGRQCTCGSQHPSRTRARGCGSPS